MNKLLKTKMLPQQKRHTNYFGLYVNRAIETSIQSNERFIASDMVDDDNENIIINIYWFFQMVENSSNQRVSSSLEVIGFEKSLPTILVTNMTVQINPNRMNIEWQKHKENTVYELPTTMVFSFVVIFMIIQTM